jgi:hypothetical protein
MFPLAVRLGGPQSWSGHRLEEKFFACAGDRTLIIQSVVRLHTVVVHVDGGETVPLNCGHQRAYSSPMLYMSVESHCGIQLTRKSGRTRREPFSGRHHELS